MQKVGLGRAGVGQAIGVFEDLGSRLELGRALEHCGAMWQARGNAAAAEEDLARARAILALPLKKGLSGFQGFGAQESDGRIRVPDI